MMSPNLSLRVSTVLLTALLLCVTAPAAVLALQTQPVPGQQMPVQADEPPATLRDEIRAALVKLPLAALLGAALALRPKRRGTPPRQTAVVQTQIILSVVGAVIMLVVGASLARAFGIVGAANLIRYRSKIEDPKDAVVMLCALSVGLAAGAGLFALGIISTVFLVGALWVIESYEPEVQKCFDLTVKAGEKTDELRPRVERVLERFGLECELRTSSKEEISYDVQMPLEVAVEDVSDALLRLDPSAPVAVDWDEKKGKRK